MCTAGTGERRATTVSEPQEEWSQMADREPTERGNRMMAEEGFAAPDRQTERLCRKSTGETAGEDATRRQATSGRRG